MSTPVWGLLIVKNEASSRTVLVDAVEHQSWAKAILPTSKPQGGNKPEATLVLSVNVMASVLHGPIKQTIAARVSYKITNQDVTAGLRLKGTLNYF